MSDDLTALRQAVQALSRRKSKLSREGRNKLTLLAGNLKTYEKLRGNVIEKRDVPVLNLARKLLLQALTEIERELKSTDTA